MYQHQGGATIIQGNAHQFINGMTAAFGGARHLLQFFVKKFIRLLPVDGCIGHRKEECHTLWEKEFDDLLPRTIVIRTTFYHDRLYHFSVATQLLLASHGLARSS